MATAAVPRPGRRRGAPSSTRRLATFLVTSARLVLVLLTVAAIAALLVLHRGDAEGSARLANAEVEAQLERGESVEQRVAVMQRNWWDYFRVTHGVLAATDRRLIFVGVPPEPLVTREFEPLEFLVRSIPFDRTADVQPARQFLGTLPGLQLSAAGARERFAYSAIDRGRADSVVAVIRRRLGELRLANEAERRATEATSAASRRPIYHLVQRGEALDGIAARYGVAGDSLMTWNRLTSSRINAGRRLLVKPGSK